MNKQGETALPLSKVKQKGQVTIPVEIREELGLHEGDYVDVKREGSRIVLTPKNVVDRHPEIDAAMAEGLADIRGGRLSPSFKNLKDFEAWLKTDEGKKFAKT